MAFSRSGGSKDGGRKFGGGYKGGSDRPPMFAATCATCGKDCQVPFKPNGRKPVLCSNCFESDGPSESRRFDHSRPDRSGSSATDVQLKAINAKLDAILKLLNDV